MQLVKATAFLFVLAAAFTGHSFAADANTVAQYYNSYFDFARNAHGMQIDTLAAKGYAKALNEEETRYRVEFGDAGYIDAHGNTYHGGYDYFRSTKEESVGRIERMDFDDFRLNDVKVSGAKISIINEMEDGELKRMNWCSSRCESRVTGLKIEAEPLSYHLENGETITFSGQLRKNFVWNDFGHREVLIEGYSEIATADGKFGLMITEPLVMTPHCRWMQSGTTAMSVDGKSLGDIDYRTEACSAAYAFADQQHLSQHQLWD